MSSNRFHDVPKGAVHSNSGEDILMDFLQRFQVFSYFFRLCPLGPELNHVRQFRLTLSPTGHASMDNLSPKRALISSVAVLIDSESSGPCVHGFLPCFVFLVFVSFICCPCSLGPAPNLVCNFHLAFVL